MTIHSKTYDVSLGSLAGVTPKPQETFKDEYHRVKPVRNCLLHNSSKHALPSEFQKRFNRILKPGWKPWKSITDETLLKNVAAWSWLQHYCDNRALYDLNNVGIGASKLSRLMCPLTLAHQISRDCVYAVMGSYTWAALGMQMESFDEGGFRHFTFSYVLRRLEFIFVTDPLDWMIVPFQGTRLPGRGIVMQQDGESLPLIRHTLQQKQHALQDSDLVAICKLLNLETSANSDIEDRLLALAKHYCASDDATSEAVQNELALYMHVFGCDEDETKKAEDAEDLLQDPLVEAVYDELGDDDKGEFPEIKKAKQKRKLKEKFGAWHDELGNQATKKKKKQDGKHKSEKTGAGAKAKTGKGKAKAKAQAPAGDEPLSGHPEVDAANAALDAALDEPEDTHDDVTMHVDHDDLPEYYSPDGDDPALDPTSPPLPPPALNPPAALDDAAVAAEAVAAAPAAAAEVVDGGEATDSESTKKSSSSTSKSSSSSSSSSDSSSSDRSSRSPSPAKLDGKIHSFGFCTGWELVKCEHCGEIAGRYKFSEDYGARDGETWIYCEFLANCRHTA